MGVDGEEVKPAAAYLRRSTHRQKQSLEDQEKAILAYAAQNGFDVVTYYKDDAVSGTSTNGRKAFEQMMADSENGSCPFRYVLVYDVKRFSRGDNDEAGHHRYLLKQRGIEVKYVSENFAGDETDDLLRPVRQWQAREDSRDLSRVTFRGLLTKVKQGFWLGGVPPYGYDLKYESSDGKDLMKVRFLSDGRKEVYGSDGKLSRTVPRGERLKVTKEDRARLVLSHPERVEIVRRIFQMCIEEGIGLKTIAARLNEEGIPSPRNGNWSKNTGRSWPMGTIRTILMNPLYTGQMVWNRRSQGTFHAVEAGEARKRPESESKQFRKNDEKDWIVVPDTHPAIIDRETFDRAQNLLKDRAHNLGMLGAQMFGRGGRSAFLLSGLIRCARCGHAFQGYTTHTAKRRKTGAKIASHYYACGGYVSKGNAVCRRKLLRQKETEDYVLERIGVRVEAMLADGGRELLRQRIVAELSGTGAEVRRELEQVRGELSKIDDDTDRLLDSLTPVNKKLVDRKLLKLGENKHELEERLRSLEVMPHWRIEPEELAEKVVESLEVFKELFEQGTLEEKKQFIGAFVEKIEIDPDSSKGRLYIRDFPALPLLRAGKSSQVVVAGAGYQHQKNTFRPLGR